MGLFNSIKKDMESMTFLDHLEELRHRLFVVVFGIVIGTTISFLFSDFIMNLLLVPAQTMVPPLDLQVLTVQGMFMMKLQVAVMTGIVLAIPVLVHQIWGFIAPGLYPHERKYLPIVILSTFGLFLAGLAFGYFLMIPLAIQFLTSIGPEFIKFNVSINAYMSFVLRLCLMMGFVFELPLIALILGKLGLISSDFLVKYWRHAVVVIFLIAAIFTPPDIMTQALMGIPLVLLYGLSIFIVKSIEKKKTMDDDEDRH